MTKKELAVIISNKVGISNVYSLELIDTIIDTIKEIIIADQSLELRGFGKFHLKKVKQKIGRNIGKNIEVVIPAHSKPAFMPYDEFKKLCID